MEVFKEDAIHVVSLGIWQKIVFPQEDPQIISQEVDVEMVVEGLLVEGSITGGKEKEEETELCLCCK